jgi:polyhydroxyalkanoate synthase
MDAEAASYQAISSGIKKVPGRKKQDPLAKVLIPDAGEDLDRRLHAWQATFTASLSPASLLLAYLDWSLHMANAPAHRLRLARAAAINCARLASPKRWLKPEPRYRRFQGPAWAQPPFNLIAQAFLLTEDWWAQATRPMPGVTQHHADVVAFAARQLLDIFAPTNCIWTNPEVLRATIAQGGVNLARGYLNFLEDVTRAIQGEGAQANEKFRPGRDVALTPGTVVMRNDLMELIQYAPATGKVHPEPVLIIPAWIMKYYILDLAPQESLVRYLTGQGFTVFCISWKNPGREARDTAFDDYRRLGVMAALDAITAICGGNQVHALGYCLGGTLLACAAAAMARDGDSRLKTMTLLAGQIDFHGAGELQLFTDESQLALLDDMMWVQGHLGSRQMAGAFQMLRSNDLFWSHIIKAYLLGQREESSSLMAWNADATRMPYRMHSEYLHTMFLNNDLSEGRFAVEGHPVSIEGIDVPIFALGTEFDHVAPWRSVYEIHRLNHGDITFALASGGHNAGVVSPPDAKDHYFRMAERRSDARYIPPDAWLASAPRQPGSWWPAYADWLWQHSSTPADPPAMGSAQYHPLCAAPGTYVLEH